DDCGNVGSDSVTVPVIPPPCSITSVGPTTGCPGDFVVITGTDFGAIEGNVSFDITGTAIIFWSDTIIVVSAPGGDYSSVIITPTASASCIQPGFYSYDDQAPTGLVAIPAGDSYCTTTTVTLTASDGTIYYTIDGTEPTTGSPVYTEPIDIIVDTTLKFMAVDVCGNQSATVTEVYDIDTEPPTGLAATPAGGDYCVTSNVSLTASDGTIYYTTDGSGPTTASPVYTDPIDIIINTTLKFIAVDICDNISEIIIEVYNDDTAATVSITFPVDGVTIFTGNVTITGTADTDITTVTVTSDQGHGESSGVDSEGNWSVILMGVIKPSITIFAQGTDECGNTGSDSATLPVISTISIITSIYPKSGIAGTNVSVHGVNFGAFQGSSIIKLDNTEILPDDIILWSDKKIIAKVPTDAAFGPAFITVIRSGLNTCGHTFTVLSTTSSGIFVDGTTNPLIVFNDSRDADFGDIDDDGDLDIILANWGLIGNEATRQNRLYLNDGSGNFTDITSSALPADTDMSWDAEFADVDGDCDLDIFIVNDLNQNRLYLNDGSGIFIDGTTDSVPVDSDWSLDAAFGDVDGDGDLDIFIANEDSQNRLYLNDGTGKFTDVTGSALPIDSEWSWNADFADVDTDGDLDVFIVNTSNKQSRLYLNNGSGIFVDGTTDASLAGIQYCIDADFADVNGDDYLDLFLAMETSRNRLYLNNGSGNFIDVTNSSLPLDTDISTSAKFGDVDGNGTLDIIIGNWFDQNRLYLNDGSGNFTDVTGSFLPVDTDISWDVDLGDVNGDGDLDIFISTKDEDDPNRLLLNE
ncbi:MAG: VCBS repeat-containing protein, partial [Deltaproteobacteria bacterium]